MVTDPVCKMDVDPAKAAAKVEYAGQVYYFCSVACHKAFTANLRKYAGSAPRGPRESR
ncbi:MAG: YHS domain-containing protein [Gammaproteobacteria bacterium]|nr:YHS domain-containing protein [Gammaproteobacteria bacterium]